MRKLKKLVIVQPLLPDAYRILDERPDIEWCVVDPGSPTELAEEIEDADGMTIRVMNLPEEVLDAAKRLRVISRHGVGYDNIPVAYCTRRNIAIAITAGANSNAVAEHAFYLMLAAARAGMEMDHGIREGDFAIRSRIVGIELAGKSLLVVGYGRIGQQLAARAKAFGMRILVHDPFQVPTRDSELERVDSLNEALPQADFVSLHLPLTPETAGMIGGRELDLLPDNAIIVNSSRGGLIDEAALIDRINSGKLFGAGLDTFCQEPLPTDSPLLAERRIILSPHSAALTDNSLRAMGRLAIRNALAGIDGTLDPAMVVNPDSLA